MVELAGISPFGGGGVNIRPNSEPTAQAVPAIEAAIAGQGLSGRMSSGQSQTNGGNDGSPEQQPAIKQKEPFDRNAVPGPPPTFEISLLEMDRNLAEALARINAAHAIARDAEAISSRRPESGVQSQAVQTKATTEAVETAEPASIPEASPPATAAYAPAAEDHSAA